MPGRRVRDERDARNLLDAVDRSGQSLASWCRASGVDGRSLNAWRLNLARRDGSKPVPAEVHLVELFVEDSGRGPTSVFRITHGSFVVDVAGDVAGDVDAESLRRVLWAVSRC